MFEEWYLNELFSRKIRDVWKLTDYYLLKVIFNILEETGIIDLLENPISVNDIVMEKKYPEKVFSALQWMLDRLVLDDYLVNIADEAGDSYRLTNKKMDYDLNEIREKANETAPDSLAAFNMLQLMAENYPAYLEGKKSGVDIIFSPGNIEITNEYYSNNLFYNVHNIAGAKILNWDMDKVDNPVVLEIGGGLGGGTKQFLMQRLADNKPVNNFTYNFTDVANKMLRTTRKSLAAISDDISAFNFKKVDFNKELAQQGFEENSVDFIWGVNAAHVASDLRFTLNQFYKALKPGGSLILSETVRPVGNRMIQQELILNTIDDYWNVNIDKEIRPRHGFMDWTDWVNALKAIGFKNAGTEPDMSVLQQHYDNCYVAVMRAVKE